MSFKNILLILFPVISSLLISTINLYIYTVFTRSIFKPYSLVVATVLITITIFEVLYFFSFRNYFLQERLYAFAIFCFAFSISFFFIAIFYSPFEFLATKIPFSSERRRSLKAILDISFLIFAFSYFLKGIYNAIKKPTIKEVEVVLKNLKKELNFAIISDLHLGEYLKEEFLQRVVEEINSLEYDALLIVGDMFDVDAKRAKKLIEPLKNIKKPIFFVTGNHEYFVGAADLVKLLKESGIVVLDDRMVEFEGLNLAGANDLIASSFGYENKSVDEILKDKKSDQPTLFLAHQPKYVIRNIKDEADLCICGHTHAGQIFPFGLLVKMDQKYLHGLYRDEFKQIYVSSGVGFWGPPIRILAPAEIVLLKLIKE